MKEFEKRWSNENGHLECYATKKFCAEEYWKDALKWVLEMFTTNEMHPPATLDVRQEIRDELKG